MDGRQHFELVKAAIPPRYVSVVSGELYVRNGRVYERLLESVPHAALPNEEIAHPRLLMSFRGKVAAEAICNPTSRLVTAFSSR